VAATTSAPWSLTYDTTAGSGSLRLRVTDRAGNYSYPTDHYIVDNTPPTIGGLAFVDEPAGRVKGYEYAEVAFADTDGVNRDEWWIDGVLAGSHSTGSQDPSWAYSSFGGSTLGYNFGTTERVVPIEVHAWDRAGNETTRAFTVVVDATGPTVTSITPAEGALVRGGTITGTVAATDPAGIGDLELNNYLSDSVTKVTVPNGDDGRTTLTFKVYDTLGNATTVVRHVIVDNTKPALTITSAPKNGAKVKGTVKVTASATDKNGINRVELLINGKVVAKDVAAGYSFSVNTKKYGKTIKIQLRTYDKAGNARTTTTRIWHRA
jgi:archaellum component FlaF (FlaF/FlaG flagellin family)